MDSLNLDHEDATLKRFTLRFSQVHHLTKNKEAESEACLRGQ